MDVRRSQDRCEVTFDLPGVDPDSINVSVDGQSVTVQAERSGPAVDDQEWLVAERPRGRYSRQLTRGPDLDSSGLHATYVDGVLTLTIPLAEQAKPRRIEVEHPPGPAGIESESPSATGSTS